MEEPLVMELSEEHAIQEQARLIEVEKRREFQENSVDQPVNLDDESLYNLPKKNPIQLSELFESANYSNKKQNTKTDPEVQKIKSDINALSEKKLFVWEDVKNWQFKLPNTIFSGNEAPVTFYKPNQEIGTYALSKLSREQLQSIYQKGEFVIKTSDEDEGTTWRMNPLIVKGSDKIRNTFYRNISLTWHQLLQIPQRLLPRGSNYYFWRQQFMPNLFSGLRTVFSVFGKVANLVIGTRKMQMYTDQQILEELYKEHNEQTLFTYYEDMVSAFYQFVSELSESNKGKTSENRETKKKQRKMLENLSKFHNEFESKAYDMEKEKLEIMQKSDLDEEQALLEILQEKQKLLLDMMEEKKQPEDPVVRKHLTSLIRAAQITVRHYAKFQEKLLEKRNNIEAEIKKQHPVKSIVSIWLYKKIKEQMEPATQQLLSECNSQILKELEEQGLKAQEILFARYKEFQLNSKQIFKANYSRIQKKNIQPCRIFETTQTILGRHEIQQVVGSDGVTRYSEVSTKTYKTSTSFYGWRFVLQLIRWKVWTANTFHTLIHNLTSGPFGLKALFKARTFPRHYYVDSETGQWKSYGQIHPYIQVLRNVLNGIARSRENFEALPDRGIFGKNFSRIFNLIQCYVFRGLIAGTLVAVGMPLAIIVNCLVSLVLAITSWVWIPVTILIRWVYHLLFWDFDSPTRKGWCYYSPYYLTYQTLEFSPLLRAAGSLVFGALEVVTSVGSAAVVHPSLMLFGVVLGFGRIIISTVSDKIMGFITRKIGRQPEIDSLIAWKIRGTGVARQYTNSMEIDDVKFVVRSFMEKVELEEFQLRLQNRINAPQDQFNQLVSELFGDYGFNSTYNSILQQNAGKLHQILNEQIMKRKNVLPQLPSCNVKFTEAELGQLVPSCEEIIKSFVVARNMNSWIFVKFSIEEGDFKKLAEKILCELFNDNDILFPLSELDKRIEIRSSKKTKYQSISRAINGDCDLKVLTSSVAPRFRKFTRTQLCAFVDARTIQNNTTQMNEKNFRVDVKSDPSSVCYFLPFSDFKKVGSLIDEQKKNKND